MERKTLDISEVAEVLGISRAAAYAAVSRGEIPSLRVGGRVLVAREAMDRFLAAESTPARKGTAS